MTANATLLVEALSDSIRRASVAVPFDSPDSLHRGLVLYDAANAEFWRFWWDGTDSCVHHGAGTGPGADRGPVVTSTVTRFQLDTLTRLVEIRLIEMRADDGLPVRMSSAAALYNRGGAP